MVKEKDETTESYERPSNMLWWKQLESVHNRVLMIEKEELKNNHFNRTPVISFEFNKYQSIPFNELTSLDQVKTLQANLFPICNKGNFISNFLKNNLKTNQLEINTDAKTFRTFAKLREPRDLFALPKELDCPQQAPRWPTECQVTEERIEHIQWSPPVPEPYYSHTGKELKPQPVGEDSGSVIFQYYPMSAVNYVTGGSRIYISACASVVAEDELSFESRFESGNLAKAVRITSTYYELHLRTDLYTNRHMQWFYFRITNTKRHLKYRFSIVNLTKTDSLYNEGMKPLLYSTKDAMLHSIGWRRCGENIAYYKNDANNEEEEQYPSYTLTFNVEFPHADDAVYLANSYPYTYSDLQEYLSKLQYHPIKSVFTKLRLLCRTLAGNNVYYLTITSPPCTTEAEPKKKKAVIVTARVHPGETPSSWMMKGFIDYLTGDSNQARELREKFIFKLVPMLNPDGVIVGNNRCSLTGKDLNRQYRTVIRETYPSVWHTKVLIRRLQEECGVAIYVDLHAHSRKHNIFIYGCESRRPTDRLQEQIFPLMLHKNAADKFSFENCKFRIQRSKEGTGRVVVWMLGIGNSYTMEASFAGSELGSRSSTHFSTQDYESMGKTFCETLLDYCDEDPSKEKLRNKIVTRLIKEGSNADEPTNIDLSDYSSDEGDTSSSSSDEELIKEFTKRTQKAPPPSPNYPEIQRRLHNKKNKPRPKLERSMAIGKKSKRETLTISKATIDITSDALTEASSEAESCDDHYEPRARTLKPQLSAKKKSVRKKKMPPELTVTPATKNELTRQLDIDKRTQYRRPRSFSLFTTISTEPTLYSQMKKLPTKKYSSDNSNRVSEPSELQVKIRCLKKNLWTGIQGDDGPISWGKSNYTMNPFATDSEDLLRSCSKKLEQIEHQQNNTKEIKKKTKTKHKSKPQDKASKQEEISEITKANSKERKKKSKLKLLTNSRYITNTSFTDVPQNNINVMQKIKRREKAVKKSHTYPNNRQLLKIKAIVTDDSD